MSLSPWDSKNVSPPTSIFKVVLVNAILVSPPEASSATVSSLIVEIFVISVLSSPTIFPFAFIFPPTVKTSAISASSLENRCSQVTWALELKFPSVDIAPEDDIAPEPVILPVPSISNIVDAIVENGELFLIVNLVILSAYELALSTIIARF